MLEGPRAPSGGLVMLEVCDQKLYYLISHCCDRLLGGRNLGAEGLSWHMIREETVFPSIETWQPKSEMALTEGHSWAQLAFPFFPFLASRIHCTSAPPQAHQECIFWLLLHQVTPTMTANISKHSSPKQRRP